jgi:hypothetical protein
MQQVFQSVTCLEQHERELLIEVEECDPAIDALAELVVDGQFAEERQAEVLDWVCGLLQLPPGQVLAARIEALQEQGRSTRGRMICDAKVRVKTAGTEAFELGAIWHSVAVPAPGFGEPTTCPLWQYEQRSKDGSVLSDALYQLAQRWAKAGGRPSVIPAPMLLVADGMAHGWPLAPELQALMTALSKRAERWKEHKNGAGEQEHSKVQEATSALKAALGNG